MLHMFEQLKYLLRKTIFLNKSTDMHNFEKICFWQVAMQSTQFFKLILSTLEVSKLKRVIF
jgi:hypothetical protein